MKNRKLLAAVGVMIVLITLIPASLSWFYQQKSIHSVTMINDPNALRIGAGNRSDIKELVLGPIDVTTGNTNYKDVVFCVYGYKPVSYHLQIAHTTNIGFEYSVYPASLEAQEGKNRVHYLENDFYFDATQEAVPIGKYLNDMKNQEGITTGLAQTSGKYHEATYGIETKHVQKNAEPLYWRTNEKVQLKKASGGVYINYYVLRISWDGKNLTNSKETDMVYLMVDGSL